LALAGRCGHRPPGPGELLRGRPPPPEAEEAELLPPWARPHPTAMPEAPPPEEPPEGEPDAAPPDDARACVRAAGDAWIERRLRGDAARRLYRWIPGDQGRVTALLLDAEGGAAGAAPPAPAGAEEGVRVVRVRLGDPALAGGRFPAVTDPTRSERLVDADFWEDDDGALRGWIHLPEAGDGPGEGDEEPAPRSGAEGAGVADAPLPLSTRRGGRVAGVRIAPGGEVTVYPLPRGVEQVVYGARFALAMAPRDDGAPSYFETTDGGRTFRPVEGPPVGRLEPPSSDQAAFGCSEIGCNLGDQGLVRLGWGGPAPAPPDVTPPPAPSPAPPAPGLHVTCRLEADPRTWPPPPPPPSPLPLVTVHTRPGASLGASRDGAWTTDALPPFDPAARPRRLAIRDRAPAGTSSAALPVLTASGAGADLLLVFDVRGSGSPSAPSAPRPVDRLRVRAAASPPAFAPFDPPGTLTAAADRPGGARLALDAARPPQGLATPDAARPVARLVRVQSPADTRLTLAARLDGKGVALVGYTWQSGEVFAGPIDLPRAEVGPLEPLGPLAAVAEIGSPACSAARPALRFVAAAPAILRVESSAGRVLLEDSVQSVALLAAGPRRICAEALELEVRSGASPLGITAAFGPKQGAALRGAEGRLTCRLEPPP
ncbi:MAG: hypothetical protein IT372_20740, partial [Polyangiaceae bacterium]|nr:hypothetical protein [Polyangiaceae bacterium]